MVKIENVAREFLGDKVHITLPPREIYKEEWELDLFLEEGDKLSLIESVMKLENNPDKAKEIFEQQENLVRGIMRRSYDGVLSDKQINMFVLNRSTELVLELSFKFGIRDRDAYEALLVKRNDEIKKIKEGSQPEKETQ